MREKKYIVTACIFLCILVGYVIAGFGLQHFKNGFAVGKATEKYKSYFELKGEEEKTEKLEALEKELEDAETIREINEILKKMDAFIEKELY